MFTIKRIGKNWDSYVVERTHENVTSFERATKEDLLELYRQLVISYKKDEEISVLKNITSNLSKKDMYGLIAVIDRWMTDGLDAEVFAFPV